ncbi:MAG: CBS domain-containing protein [Lewinellaceae bacterium]|nr:CBS domain-containing protein [Lewinella sp.]MCB9277924.1 CBS domain-containing protein [Lewinellaceae bacterium]
MTAETLLSTTILPLRTSDTGEDALAMMNDFLVRHLPVVNNEQLLGLLSEEDILNADVEEPVGSYSLSIPSTSVQLTDHIYEVMRLLADYQLTVIPVVDIDGNYAGLITLEDLLRYFATSSSFQDPGSIVVLEMGRHDYSLVTIARIVESENAAILSSFITSYGESTRIDVTIKINRMQIGGILAGFERFNLHVKASFNEQVYFDTLKERYDSLINYLNV